MLYGSSIHTFPSLHVVLSQYARVAGDPSEPEQPHAAYGGTLFLFPFP